MKENTLAAVTALIMVSGAIALPSTAASNGQETEDPLVQNQSIDMNKSLQIISETETVQFDGERVNLTVETAFPVKLNSSEPQMLMGTEADSQETAQNLLENIKITSPDSELVGERRWIECHQASCLALYNLSTGEMDEESITINVNNNQTNETYITEKVTVIDLQEAQELVESGERPELAEPIQNIESGNYTVGDVVNISNATQEGS